MVLIANLATVASAACMGIGLAMLWLSFFVWRRFMAWKRQHPSQTYDDWLGTKPLRFPPFTP